MILCISSKSESYDPVSPAQPLDSAFIDSTKLQIGQKMSFPKPTRVHRFPLTTTLPITLSYKFISTP